MSEEKRDAVVQATVAVATIPKPPDRKTALLDTLQRHLLGALKAAEDLREVVKQ